MLEHSKSPQRESREAKQAPNQDPSQDLSTESLHSSYDLSSRRSALRDTYNHMGYGIVEGAKLSSSLQIEWGARRLREFPQEVAAGLYDKLLLDTALNRNITNEALPFKVEFIKELFPRLVKETGMFNEISRYIPVEKECNDFVRRLGQLDLEDPRSFNSRDLRFALALCSDIAHGDFTSIRGMLSLNAYQHVAPPPPIIALPLTRLLQLGSLGFLSYQGSLLDGLICVAAIQYTYSKLEGLRTPNRSLRHAFQIESCTQMMVDVGEHAPLSYPGAAFIPSTEYSIFLLRALRLAGELPDYIAGKVREASFDRKNGKYPDLEEEMHSVREDLAGGDKDKLPSILTALHGVQLLRGYENRLKGLQIANEVILALKSA